MLTTHYPPPFSGASVRAWNIVKLLSKLKELDRIFIIELSRNSMIPGQYFNKEYVYTAKDRLLRILRVMGLNDLGYLKQVKPLAVIATLPPSLAIKIGIKTYHKLGIPILCDVQDVTDEYKIGFTNKLYSTIYKSYYATIYKALSLCDSVYAVTEIMAKIIENKIGKEVHVAPNGSNPDMYKYSYERFKHKRPCDPICTAVFVGSLDWEYQKLDSMIKAIYTLKKEYGLKIKLRIVGMGKYLRYYINLAKKLNMLSLVKFYGYVPINELPDLISSSDFGIVGRPSARNNWIISSMRMTVYDYLSAGIPILAFGPPYSYTKLFILRNNVGVYVPSDDPQDIAYYIYCNLTKLLSIDREYCRKIGEKYSWDNTLAPIIKFIKYIIQ